MNAVAKSALTACDSSVNDVTFSTCPILLAIREEELLASLHISSAQLGDHPLYAKPADNCLICRFRCSLKAHLYFPASEELHKLLAALAAVHNIGLPP